jgi:hypothetical protein
MRRLKRYFDGMPTAVDERYVLRNEEGILLNKRDPLTRDWEYTIRIQMEYALIDVNHRVNLDLVSLGSPVFVDPPESSVLSRDDQELWQSIDLSGSPVVEGVGSSSLASITAFGVSTSESILPTTGFFLSLEFGDLCAICIDVLYVTEVDPRAQEYVILLCPLKQHVLHRSCHGQLVRYRPDCPSCRSPRPDRRLGVIHGTPADDHFMIEYHEVGLRDDELPGGENPIAVMYDDMLPAGFEDDGEVFNNNLSRFFPPAEPTPEGFWDFLVEDSQ